MKRRKPIAKSAFESGWMSSKTYVRLRRCVSPITTVDELHHSTLASATFKRNFSHNISYGVLPLSALCGR